MRNFKVFIVLLAVLMVSCDDSATDYRLKQLEQRVLTLEKVRSGSQTTTSQQTANVQQVKLAEDTNGGDARFQWNESTLFNFGNIKQGEVVEHVFEFTNTGSEDLQISGTSASCGCTVPEHSKDPVPPGGKGKVVVKFDSKGKSGQQNPVVTVNANTSPKQIKLTMRGFVTPNS